MSISELQGLFRVYVVGEDGDDYDKRLRTLIGFFLAARVLREEPMLAVIDDGRVVAVAILTSPGDRAAPAALRGRSAPPAPAGRRYR